MSADRNGSHLMFYSNTAATSGIEIKYNVFSGVTEWEAAIQRLESAPGHGL